MKFVDDLHQKPQQAFTGAVIMASGALRWIVKLTEPHGVRFIPIIAAFGFTLGSFAFALRGRQMQREEAWYSHLKNPGNEDDRDNQQPIAEIVGR